MRAECLPISSIPHVSRLYQDYLNNFERVSSFYPHPPFSNFYAPEAKSLKYPGERRQRVADVLEKQNRNWGASAKTLVNIGRFREGSAALVTGQQVSLFGGPLFSLLKALTAVKHADAATAAGVETVPIFWLATEDHDLAEVSSTTLYDKGFGLRKLSVATQSVEGAPVGTVCFGAEIRPLVKEALELLGESEAADILRGSYAPGASFGEAFAKLFSRLFADFGVIVLDASDAELHRVAEPVYADAVRRAAEINSALLARGKELEHAGYHAQVKVSGSSTTLFMLQDGVRTPVQRVNSHFSIGKVKLSAAELIARVKAHPEEFSANALMRPAVQDYLLPTLAYVGGPAEVAYFAQSAVVYEQLLGRVTPILPRISATLVEPKIARLLSKYRVNVAETFQGPEHLKQLLAKRSLPAGLDSAFDSTRDDIETDLKGISTRLQQLDPTLVDAAKKSASKILYQLSRLQSRAATAVVRKDAEIGRHGEQIASALFPHKNLQEREIAGVEFLARHGTSLLRQIYDGAQINCPDHHVFYL
ncbi:MAG: hypothetical protein JWO20_2766 [Candidatus Angelobacter sp.]|jgi:bacillithiol biosynthesis cysteine-adding enzyme BshC|nr:hypothetical protein [Candidatus Angelobacter sp.]